MAGYFRVLFFTSLLVALLARTWGRVRCCAGLGGRLGLNSFIQTRQVYTYEIPMGNRVRIIASQTHTRLPNGRRFCLISIPMGTIFVPYPYHNRRIHHGLAGIGSPIDISRQEAAMQGSKKSYASGSNASSDQGESASSAAIFDLKAVVAVLFLHS
jgi:hypothetical protein